MTGKGVGRGGFRKIHLSLRSSSARPAFGLGDQKPFLFTPTIYTYNATVPNRMAGFCSYFTWPGTPNPKVLATPQVGSNMVGRVDSSTRPVPQGAGISRNVGSGRFSTEERSSRLPRRRPSDLIFGS